MHLHTPSFLGKTSKRQNVKMSIDNIYDIVVLQLM